MMILLTSMGRINMSKVDGSFYMDDFYDRVMLGFIDNSWSKDNQYLLLYRAIVEFLKLSEGFPESFVSGLVYLVGLLSIPNEC